MPNPIVLIHGYSDSGKSFELWKERLCDRGCDANIITVGNYVSLSNEVTVKDIAEGFDRALKFQGGVAEGTPFDAIVHSTGMLVIRSWLTNYAVKDERIKRLKRLVGLAPATFGSPLAHKGRSWLGSIFKGSKTLGPDFMEAGDCVLDALELGSKFTWDLAHLDLLGDEAFYGPTRKTPYAFILCGEKGYGGLRSLISEDGTDGTVRWAGCALNTRKVVIDLTRQPGDEERLQLQDWSNVDSPLVFARGHNHSSILTSPSGELVDAVFEALQVDSENAFNAWQKKHAAKAAGAVKQLESRKEVYQQFFVRAVDERGDPIEDYNMQLLTKNAKGDHVRIPGLDLDVHTYRADSSLRCFHVNLSKLPAGLKDGTAGTLVIQVIASTGSKLVGYQAFGDTSSIQDVSLDISPLLKRKDFSLFYPFTTTLLELRLNREPLPLQGKNDVFWFS
jgi:hypothetical protein